MCECECWYHIDILYLTAEAEAKRVAEAEAKRVAEAEAKRVAEAEAKRVAEAKRGAGDSSFTPP